MKFAIEVRGRQEHWIFLFNGRREDLAAWRDDGLEVYPVAEIIPAWAWPVARLWVFFRHVLLGRL
jgi:hypothetical protein